MIKAGSRSLRLATVRLTRYHVTTFEIAESAQRQASYEDILNAPPELVAEILAGRLVTHPRPAPRHALASFSLGGEMVGPFQEGRGGPGGWWILGEPELHLDADVLVPDIAGWRRERIPRLPETDWLEIAPDWVCDVLSPSTARDDRVAKMPIYARAGIGHLWLIDPSLRMPEVYGLQAGHWVLLEAQGDDAPVSPPPFGTIDIDLSSLWA